MERVLTEQELVRREKAEKIRSMGLDPFGQRYDKSDFAADLKSKYGSLEHDAFENAQFSYDERYDYYYSNLLKQFLAIREKYKQFDFPIITGGLCRDWKKRYIEQSEAVEKATVDMLEDTDDEETTKRKRKEFFEKKKRVLIIGDPIEE